ncbi:MAG: hypothetical protein IMF10_03855 [Proteobacteria bacterium]|nr:hypothetical protein [Pseudomonadota bacterium]
MAGRSVAVIGSATIDRITQGGKSVCRLGGVVTYGGLTFKRHGIETVVVTNVADRDESILKALHEGSIRVFRGHTGNTTHFINHVDINTDSRWQEMPAKADPITASQVVSVLDDVDHLHIGALHPFDIDQEVIESLNKTNLLISMDVQGYVRYREGSRIRHRVSDNLAGALSCAGIVKADETELATILDSYKMDLAGLMRAYTIDEMVVTAGARRGGFIRNSAGDEIHYDAEPVESPACTVGAGDVFFAAYLVHRFYRGKGISVSSGLAASLAARQSEGRHISAKTLRLER